MTEFERDRIGFLFTIRLQIGIFLDLHVQSDEGEGSAATI